MAVPDPDLTREQQEIIVQLQGTRKIVINTDFGGFGLSRDAWVLWCLQKGWDPDDENLHDHMIERDCPALVKIVEAMGADANGPYSRLKIVEIPADVFWELADYDGREWIAEQHRTWR